MVVDQNAVPINEVHCKHGEVADIVCYPALRTAIQALQRCALQYTAAVLNKTQLLTALTVHLCIYVCAVCVVVCVYICTCDQCSIYCNIDVYTTDLCWCIPPLLQCVLTMA
jgi:hypothetical protein